MALMKPFTMPAGEGGGYGIRSEATEGGQVLELRVMRSGIEDEGSYRMGQVALVQPFTKAADEGGKRGSASHAGSMEGWRCSRLLCRREGKEGL